MKRFCFVILLMIAGIQSPGAQVFTNYTTENSNLPSNQINAICLDESNHLWFGTSNGLCRYDGQSWQVFQKTGDKQTLADDFIFDVHFGKADFGPEIWAGTKNGVTVAGIGVDALTFATPYRTDNTDLVNNRVRTITIDSNHVRWFGTEGGVSSFDGDTWAQYTLENWWIYHNMTMSSATGPDDMNYFGSEGAGVARLRMDPVDGITAASAIDWSWSEIPSDSVYSIYIEEDGDQWFGTDKGVAYHYSYNTREDWIVYNTGSGLAGDTIFAICEDLAKNIWVGSTTGLSMFDGNSWTSWTAADGLASDHINDIVPAPDGSLWIATDAGISQYVDPAGVTRSTNTQLPTKLTMSNFPNPFNLSTQIALNLPKSGAVSLIIYNTLGEKIRTLTESHMIRGVSHVNWDGRDDKGRTVESGIYLVRAEQSGKIQTLKITLTK